MFEKDAVCVEAVAMPGIPQELRGIPAILSTSSLASSEYYPAIQAHDTAG